jgi:hypothetical protein
MTTATAIKTKKVPTSPDNLDPDTGNLLLSVGCRLKLTADQQDSLRKSFNAKLLQPTTVSNSVTVVTHKASTVEAELGMDRLTFASVVASRESHVLPLILRLQRVLEVPLVSEDQIRSATESYIRHLKENYWN